MTQKVKASPSLKGALKEDLHKEILYEMQVIRSDFDKENVDRFNSVFGRLSDLEKDSFTKNERSFFEDNYYLILIVAVVIYIAALIYIRQSE